MNPTLFYNNNPSLKHPAWDADSHFKYLAQKKVLKKRDDSEILFYIYNISFTYFL